MSQVDFTTLSDEAKDCLIKSKAAQRTLQQHVARLVSRFNRKIGDFRLGYADSIVRNSGAKARASVSKTLG